MGGQLSSTHLYFSVTHDGCGLPSTVPGLNRHKLKALRAASSKRE
jgi:hypothetical protein